MALTCAANFVKVLLFIFNAIVLIGGAVLCGFGIYLIVKLKKAENSTVALPALILTVGLILFCVGFLGCVGACRENECMLKTFAIVICILFVAMIVLGSLLFVYRHRFVDMSAEAIKKQIQSIIDGTAEDPQNIRKKLDEVQKELKCCGGRGPTDWDSLIPTSCIDNETHVPYQRGCAYAIYDVVESQLLAFAIVIIVLAVLQGFSVLGACYLWRRKESLV